MAPATGSVTDTGPLVVDVKRGEELAKPQVKRVTVLTRRVVASRGWNYEVRCEPDAILYANVKFLAAYRHDWQFDPEVLGALRAAAADGPTPCLKAIVDDVDLPESTAIARLMHLL